jgi:serine/threonine-protein kinase
MTAPSFPIESLDEVQRIAQVLATLPAEQQFALELRHLEGWKLHAIAGTLQRTEVEVAALLRTGLRVLFPDGTTDSMTVTLTVSPDAPPPPVDVILADYLQAVDSGQVPDRVAFLEQHRELAAYLLAMDQLTALAERLRESWPSRMTAPLASATTLADRPRKTEPAGGLEIPGYDILEVLGAGGMGVVYLAFDRSLKRQVALKMIRGGKAGASELARFRAEAEAVARLQHPNIVQVFEIDEHDGQPYCALEYVPGGTLAAHLARTAQPPRWAAEMTRTLALAVEAAHQASIVHRDLKPANVLLTRDGKPKVTDFGLVKYLDDASGFRSEGIMGTPNYMAPEQAAGEKEVGPATDVYALGAILYEMLTGSPPFKGATAQETLALVCTQDPVPVRQLQPKVPPDLEAIVHKCLHKDPGKRYASAQELADRLQLFLAGEPIPERPRNWLNKVARFVWKRPLLSSAVGLLAVAVVTALLLWHYLDPELPRKEVNWTLASGKPYTFKGSEALPGPFRRVYGDPVTPTAGAGGTDFFIHSDGIVLFELTDALPCDSYELFVDVRHDAASGESQVGIYFGFRQIPPPAGGFRQGGFYTLTFADLGIFPDRFPDGTVRGWVSLQVRLFEDKPNPSTPQSPKIASIPSRPALPLVGSGPWRRLHLIVSKTTVKAGWEPAEGRIEPLLPISGEQLDQRLQDLGIPLQKFREVPTDYRPRAGLGLYVARGKASFRNLTVKPIPTRE